MDTPLNLSKKSFAVYGLGTTGRSVINYFNKIKKYNCLISRDLSTIQRKELYNILEKQGFDRSLLYKHYTY